MKQYIYKAAEAGLEGWPSGELRLDGIERTDNPKEADLFVCPGSLRLFESSSGILDLRKLHRLPYFPGAPDRHVFFDVSDNFTKPIDLPILFIRCDARDWMIPYDPNTIQMAWPVEDFAECIPVPEGGFKYDVSFHGWLSTETRKISSDACKQDARLKSDVAQYSDFCGYIYYEPEGIRRRREFRRSMQESRVSLCPESIPGVFPYRFFEAMSAGRVPLLVGSDFVFPFAAEIDYKAFSISCSRAEAYMAAGVVSTFLRNHSDDEIVAMGKLARQAWEQWLDCRRWPSLHTYAVQKRLGVLKAA